VPERVRGGGRIVDPRRQRPHPDIHDLVHAIVDVLRGRPLAADHVRATNGVLDGVPIRSGLPVAASPPVGQRRPRDDVVAHPLEVSWVWRTRGRKDSHRFVDATVDEPDIRVRRNLLWVRTCSAKTEASINDNVHLVRPRTVRARLCRIQELRPAPARVR
jgi:hypothetical protein